MGDIVYLDGVKCRVLSADLDGDGKRGDTEILTERDRVDISSATDMKDALGELNKDDVNPTTRNSAIELRSRINNDVQLSSLTQFITLVSMGVFPRESLALALTCLRLNVSWQGLGRKEIVNVTTGQREHEERKGGMLSRMGDKLSPKNEVQV